MSADADADADQIKASLNGKTWGMLLLLAGVLLTVQGFVAVEVWRHGEALAATGANRFTDEDARFMQERIFAKIPPKWVADQLLSHERRIQRLEELE